jgi:hypothetical protein
MCYQPPGTGICVTFSHLWWGDASGWCVSPYLSIYPRIVDMYELIFLVWWLVKNLELFKFVRPNCASMEPWLSTCDACYFSLCWFVYHVICITSSISHLCTWMQIESEKSSKCVIGIWGLRKSPSAHLGGVSFSIGGYTHLLCQQIVVVINHQKGEIEVHLGP